MLIRHVVHTVNRVNRIYLQILQILHTVHTYTPHDAQITAAHTAATALIYHRLSVTDIVMLLNYQQPHLGKCRSARVAKAYFFQL